MSKRKYENKGLWNPTWVIGRDHQGQWRGGAGTKMPRAGPVKITRPDGTIESQPALTYRQRRDLSSFNRSRVSSDMKRRVFERDKGKCQECGTDKAPFHVDHVRPYSKGGWNVLSNLQLLCARCNTQKGAQWEKRDITG